MLPPPKSVEIVAVEGGSTLIHCAATHVKRCTAGFSQTSQAWLASLLFFESGRDRPLLYRDMPELRVLFCVPDDAPPCGNAELWESRTELDRSRRHPVPAMQQWENARFSLFRFSQRFRNGERVPFPILPIGRFI
jgi:hypothetical protein